MTLKYLRVLSMICTLQETNCNELELQMDLVKVHEGHVRVLENELAAHKNALHQADLKEAALLRDQEALETETKHMNERLAAAQDVLDMKRKEASDIQKSASDASCLCLVLE